MGGTGSRIWRLTVVSAALWALSALPAWSLAGTAGLEGLTYALLLCLIPGLIALAFVRAGDSANGAFTALLVGMGLRMATVLGGTLVLKQIRPDLGPSAFHVWVIVGYLVMLAVETRMLLSDVSGARHGSGLGQPTA